MRCSSDLRTRVVKFVRAGGGKHEAALRFGVGEASVYRWVRQEDETAYTRPGPRHSPDLNPIEHDFAALKKIRQFNHTKSIDQIVKAYQ